MCLIDIINWMINPIGIEQMKQEYLSNIGLQSNCNKELDIDQIIQCSNENEIKTSKKNTTNSTRSLLILFDVVAEPLFRSNIVFYSTISFLTFVIFTFIYDRFFIS